MFLTFNGLQHCHFIHTRINLLRHLRLSLPRSPTLAHLLLFEGMLFIDDSHLILADNVGVEHLKDAHIKLVADGVGHKYNNKSPIFRMHSLTNQNNPLFAAL